MFTRQTYENVIQGEGLSADNAFGWIHSGTGLVRVTNGQIVSCQMKNQVSINYGVVTLSSYGVKCRGEGEGEGEGEGGRGGFI
jgi:hypothetical protein